MAWAFATVGQTNAWLFAELAIAARRRMKDFTPQELSNIVWAFAIAGQKNEKLFAAVAAAVEAAAVQRPEFNP